MADIFREPMGIGYPRVDADLNLFIPRTTPRCPEWSGFLHGADSTPKVLTHDVEDKKQYYVISQHLFVYFDLKPHKKLSVSRLNINCLVI